MRRAQLAHLLRAACAITGDPRILVIGSQAILGSYDEDLLPADATMSAEADIAFMDDADGSKSDLVDGAIGELSDFHGSNGYYAQGVSAATATLPAGWEDRLVHWSNLSTGAARAVLLDKHDLVISKLVALRQKDRDFAAAMLDSGLVEVDVLRSRVQGLPGTVHSQVRDDVLDFLSRW